MKTLQNTLKIAMIAIVLVFASCSKDDGPAEDDTIVEEPTNHELLISGKWYIQSTSSGGNYGECERQTYLQFIDEDTLIIQAYHLAGGMNCVAETIQSISYQMITDDTFIFIGEPGLQFIIEFLSETQLVLRQTDGMSSNTYYMIK